jgi:gluconate 2-dehydrogenase gamma chain
MTSDGFCFRPDGSSERLLMRRRAFLQSLVGGAGALMMAPLRAEIDLLAPGNRPPPTELARALEETPWPTLGAVLPHLLPSEDGAPGAGEINALGYLQSALGRDEAEAREDLAFIAAGANFFRKRVALDHGGRLFGELGEAEREAAMQKMAGSTDGANWISILMYYLLEALLGDPVYGGNVDQGGWKWLGYTPGFPRPPEGKRYYELKNR